MLVVTAVVAAVVFYFGRQKYKELEAVAGQVAAGTEAATPGKAAAPGADDVCKKAIACCEALAAKSGAAQSAAGCKAMSALGDAACSQALKGYKLSNVDCDTSGVE